MEPVDINEIPGKSQSRCALSSARHVQRNATNLRCITRLSKKIAYSVIRLDELCVQRLLDRKLHSTIEYVDKALKDWELVKDREVPEAQKLGMRPIARVVSVEIKYVVKA